MAAASSNAPFILRLVSCSVAAANKAGNIIRNVLQNGDLAVVDKVSELGDCQTFDNNYSIYFQSYAPINVKREGGEGGQ